MGASGPAGGAGRAAALALLLMSAPALAQQVADGAEGPRALSFSSGEDRYEVPTDGFASLGYREDAGMEICMTAPVETEVAAFTEAHIDEVVVVAIGETEVTRVQIVSPYEGGCINWPIHPIVAANYIAMLTGTPPRPDETQSAPEAAAESTD
jgi:hypothetical protein